MIGVLALQGDFAEHKAMLDKCDIQNLYVRTIEDLNSVDGLIIPGGESTTISKLMRINGIDKALQQKIKRGFPVFGTCAGAIVLARHVKGNKFSDNNGLGLLNITVNRNAYGRQLESFETQLTVKGFNTSVPAVFIRAPMIEANNGVEILSHFKNHPVLVRQGNIIASTFHPELTEDTRIHRYFLRMIKKTYPLAHLKMGRKLACNCGHILKEKETVIDTIKTVALVCPSCDFTTLTKEQANEFREKL